MKYRKKPLIVEAYQWQPGMNPAPGVRFIPANRVDLSKTRGIMIDRPARHVIDTIGGEVQLEPWDWVVKDIGGGYYSCKPDIFAATHENASIPRARSVEGTKLLLGPNMKKWLHKTTVYGALVKEQEATISKGFLLRIVSDLTEMAGGLLQAEEKGESV